MILTDCYQFKKISTKAKMRLDCVASTRSYLEFEERRNTKEQRATEKRDGAKIGDLIIYYGDVPTQFGGDVHRKADKTISIKSNNLSSIYVPDISYNYGYGDFKGTSDALIFVFHGFQVTNGVIQAGGSLEVFVARGKSKDRVALYNMLTDGELDEEMETLRTLLSNKQDTEEE